MRLTVTKLLNKRIGAPSVNALKGAPLKKGEEIDVVEQVKGDSYDGNNLWYKDAGNNFYWSGGVSHNSNKSSIELDSKITPPWFEDTLKIPEIWEKYDTYGENVTIAILDTGCDLMNSDVSINIVDSNKFINYADSVQDIHGHGTRCSSLIGASNSFNWNIGIAPNSKLLIGKISNKGELNDFTSIIDGIKWSIEKGADIISISFGKPSSNATLIKKFHKSIFEIVQNKNVLIFAAGGNNNSDLLSFGSVYPSAFSVSKEDVFASIENIISVGAIDDKNDLALITLRNDYTIINAPGINIPSYSLNSIVDNDSGTSISTPIAAGIAALALSYIRKRDGGIWNWKDLKEKILLTGDPIKNNLNKRMINPHELFNSL